MSYSDTQQQPLQKQGIVVDSRDRQFGTANKYAVTLGAPVLNVRGGVVRWVQFYDGRTRAPVDVFARHPYVALHVRPFEKYKHAPTTHVKGAAAVLHHDFNAHTDARSAFCEANSERVFKLEVEVYDETGALLDVAGLEHVFELDVFSECSRSVGLPWGA